ncbi:MAG: NAD(P)H-dependent oxidoreductase [Planctomycetota bacterium]
MRITVLDGHPNPDSFCAALASRYVDAAEQAGHDVRRLVVRDMQFDPILWKGYREVQALEPDLVAAQQAIAWCRHLVVVHPVWWGSMPALLKGFFDRTLLPGWAFKYRKGSPFWDRLLEGRSARLIVTSGAPALYMKVAYRNAPIVVDHKMILGFCGFKPVRVTTVGSLDDLDDEQRQKALERIALLGKAGR